MARRRFERLHTYVRPTSGAEVPAQFSGMELVPGTIPLLDEFRGDNPKLMTDRKYGIISGRLRSSDEQVFFVRDTHGALVGWCHLIRGSGPDIRNNHTLRLRSDDAYFYDDMVDPNHRRQGFHRFMILRRLEIAQAQGCARAIVTISDTNRPSRASYRRLGFQVRSNLVYIRALDRAVELPLRPSWAAGSVRALKEVRRGR